MRSASTALRASLVAIAAAIAALLAHVAIDVAGDYVLAHDAYDGIDHQSRAVFAVAILLLGLGLGARLLVHLLDRRCGSTASLRRIVSRDLGTPAAFVAQCAFLAIVTLAGMEFLDCASSGTRVDDVADLFGGSMWLGVGSTIAVAALTGWFVHAVVRLIAAREPELAKLVYRLAGAAADAAAASRPVRRTRGGSSVLERALMLARRGSKRGPPLAIPG